VGTIAAPGYGEPTPVVSAEARSSRPGRRGQGQAVEPGDDIAHRGGFHGGDGLIGVGRALRPPVDTNVMVAQGFIDVAMTGTHRHRRRDAGPELRPVRSRRPALPSASSRRASLMAQDRSSVSNRHTRLIWPQPSAMTRGPPEGPSPKAAHISEASSGSTRTMIASGPTPQPLECSTLGGDAH
jgi:hypothetical protein